MKGRRTRQSPSAVRRLDRRAALKVAVAVTAVIAASGHAPYGQWNAYRKRNLLILTSRSDAPSFPVGERVARVLAEHLPESRAQVSRAPDVERVASLIGTRQIDVAVLSPRDAAAMFSGHGPFSGSGPVPLRTVVRLGEYLLVCREDFAARHAYLLAATLIGNRDELELAASALHAVGAPSDQVVPVHRGARAFFDGQPPP